MASRSRKSRVWPFVVLGAVSVILVVILLLLAPTTPLFFLLHAAALLGYLMIFFSALSSAYLRELVRWMGRPFVQVHHVLSVAGLAMITLHPLLAAIAFGTISVFVPIFDSLPGFFQNGGRLGWYLLAVASLAALFRKLIGKNWRFVHLLTYITFWLGTIHAWLLGPDIQNVPMKIILLVLALVLVYVFVKRRVPAKRPARARR